MTRVAATPKEQEDSSAEVEVAPLEGTVASDTKIEAQILIVQAVHAVSEDIADRVAESLPSGATVVAGEFSDAAAWAGYRSLIDALTSVTSSYRSRSEQQAVRAIDPIAVVKAAAGIVSFFRADYATKAVDLTISGSDLAALLAAQLVRRGFKVLSDRRPDAPSPLVQALADAHLARGEALALAADEAARAALEPLSARLESLAKVAGGVESSESAALIARAEVLAAAAAEGAYLVTVRPLAAGGGLESRTHLWRNLFLGPAVRYSGGVAAAWQLSDLSQGHLLDGGLSYDLQGPLDPPCQSGSFRRSTRRRRALAFHSTDPLALDTPETVEDDAAPRAQTTGSQDGRLAAPDFEAIRSATLGATRDAIRKKRPNAPFNLDWDLGSGGYGFPDRADVRKLSELIFENANVRLNTSVSIPAHFPSVGLAGKTLAKLLAAVRSQFVTALGH